MKFEPKKVMGGVAYSAGVAATLADWGLSAVEVVFNGAVNVANSFVKAPDLGISKAMFKATHSGLNNVSKSLKNYGKGLMR
jgi:hypothetical protein